MKHALSFLLWALFPDWLTKVSRHKFMNEYESKVEVRIFQGTFTGETAPRLIFCMTIADLDAHNKLCGTDPEKIGISVFL